MRHIFPPMLLTLSLLSSGCAVSHYDAQTGTAHLWGFGHLKMRIVPATGDAKLQAVVIGTRTIGARVDTGKDTGGLSLGYADTHLTTIVASDTALRLDTVGSDPFTLRLGTQFPGTPAMPPH